MPLKNSDRIAALTVLVVVLFTLGGCAAKRAFNAGDDFAERRQYDQAVASYQKAVEKDPASNKYNMRLIEARNKAATAHLASGRELRAAGKRAEALVEFRKATAYDPSVEVAAQEAQQVENLLRAEQLVAEGEGFYRNRRFSQARASVDQALNLDPQNAAAKTLRDNIRQGNKTIIDGIELDVSSEQPINLKFKQTGIKDVFNILSKLSGINFILDEEIKAQTNVNLLLENATFPQALELILQLNKLGKKVLNSKTIIIYPRTKDKDKQFDDQVIQTFYLSNIEAKKAVNLLRTMLQLRKIYVHEELNALVVRDTPDVIKLCTQILAAADRGDSEVVFDLELIEVSKDNALKWGPKVDPTSVSAGLGYPHSTVTTDGAPVIANIIVGNTLQTGITHLTGLDVLYTLPTAQFDFLKTLTDSETLANPKIRVKNREKAKVLAGVKQPVITTTNSTTNPDYAQENVTYVDVGVKLDIEPTIQLDNTVIAKINLEVSSLGAKYGTNSTVYAINTTNAQTTLTLKDGERTIIGGLISDDVKNKKNIIPILGDIPLLGKLFTYFDNTKGKREVLLSITPHIVINVDMPLSDVSTIWSGGEDDLKAGPAFGTFAGSFEPKTERLPTVAAPALGNAASAPAQSSATTAATATPEAFTPGETGTLSPPDAALTPPEAATAIPATVDAAPAAAEAAAVAPLVTGEPAVVPVAVPVPLVETPPQVELPPFVVPPVGDGTLKFSAVPAVKVGEELVVEVAIAGAQDLFSAPLFVNFDGALLKFVRGEEGNLLKRGGMPTVFAVSAMPGQGQLIIGYKQGVGGTGISGDGSLFRLYFTAIAPGSAGLKLERINFRNPQGVRLKVEPAATTVEIR